MDGTTKNSPPGIRDLRERLSRWVSGTGLPLSGVHVVGGSVRDALLARPCGDLDICVKGARDFARTVAKTRNAAFVPMEKDPSAPCYRVVSRSDPGDYLDVAEVRGQSISDDLSKRDFTINAMAVPALPGPGGEDADVVDPHGGQADLSARLVRHVSERNLLDDPLRVLRGFRLAASLDFSPAPESLAAFPRAAQGLSRVAGERIGHEVMLLLATPRAFPAVSAMDSCGVLAILFPELVPLRGLVQNSYHRLDAFGHTMEAFRNAEDILSDPARFFPACAAEVATYLRENGRAALIKLAALLHDVGKAATLGTNPRTGLPSFHGHEAVSAEMAREAALRLRLSNRERDFVAALTAEHLRPLFLTAPNVGEKRRVAWMAKQKDDCAGVIILSMADNMSKASSVDAENRPAALAAWLCEYYAVLRPRLLTVPLVTGKDLLDLGARPGPLMGRVLAELRRAQDEGETPDRDRALALARTLLDQG